MIILTKNILKKKKHKFNDKYDDDSFSIHNLMKPNTPTTIQPPKLMKKGIPREFVDIATNTDTIATATRETQEKLYNDANQPLNMTFEAFKVKENQDNMFQIMLKNFWHNTYKRNEPTRTQATQTLKNQRDAMVSAFTKMLDNNKPPEPPPKKPPDEDDSDEEEKKFKLTKMIEIMLRNGATIADIILNLSHSAVATTINIADLVNQITAGNAQGSNSNSSNEAISVHSSPPITVHSSSSESPTEIPAPTEDEDSEEEENQHFNFEKLKSKYYYI